MKKQRIGSFAVTTLMIACLDSVAFGQVVERDTIITGPKGNSVERRIRTERVGNMIDRQVTITRPGGTIHRETEVFAPGGFRGGPPVFVGGGGPRVIVEPVVPIVAPGVSLFFGTAPPPPPPVFVAPVAPLPPPRPRDAIDHEISSLSSIHSDHRRDASIALGRYRDARAVPALIDRLKHDHEKEVRQAAAWALGEIGDPRGIVPLEVAAQVDKKPEVKAVANKAISRINHTQAALQEQAAVEHTPAPSAMRQPQSKGWNAVANKPANGFPATRRPVNVDDDVPPPDPTPVTGPKARTAADDFAYPKASR